MSYKILNSIISFMESIKNKNPDISYRNLKKMNQFIGKIPFWYIDTYCDDIWINYTLKDSPYAKIHIRYEVNISFFIEIKNVVLNKEVHERINIPLSFDIDTTDEVMFTLTYGKDYLDSTIISKLKKLGINLSENEIVDSFEFLTRYFLKNWNRQTRFRSESGE